MFALLAVGLAFYSLLRATARPPLLVAHANSPAAHAQAPTENRVPVAPAQTPQIEPAEADPAVGPNTPVRGAQPPPVPAAKVDPLPQELSAVAPQTALENVRGTIRQYGSMFAGNPVGTNEEITQALHGANPKHIDFLTGDGNRVNSNGELVDTWGTPYFFHQISGHEMEIRSAGPDRRMYTSDDLVIR